MAIHADDKWHVILDRPVAVRGLSGEVPARTPCVPKMHSLRPSPLSPLGPPPAGWILTPTGGKIHSDTPLEKDMETTTRNATLVDLAKLLENQHARKLDVVAPASHLRAEGGLLVIEGSEPVLGPDGVTSADGHYRPTEVFDEGLAVKLGIPTGYLKRLRADRPDLYDANVNGWLRGRVDLDGDFAKADPDPRSFLVRTFRPDDDGTEGVARAFLSDSYRIVDNLDVLTAALEGIRASGVHVQVQGADLTDRRMYVKVYSPEVAALAPELLANYRSPFTGQTGADNPVVFAGFVISNSETGGGAFTLTPRLVVQICGNGMTIKVDAMRGIHLGAKQDEGVIRWSNETLQKNLELVTSKARDAAATFLDPDYVRARVDQLGKAGDEKATVDQVQTIAKQLSYPPERTAAVLDFFVSGGQPTLGGVANAITAAAQHEPDADVAADMEVAAVDLLLGVAA